MQIICLADDLHEVLSLILSEKYEKNQNVICYSCD